MCGEHLARRKIRLIVQGSSPHVRGAPYMTAQQYNYLGIIPACAGSTSHRARRSRRDRDHPRMCGEHASLDVDALSAVGSSPHVRGAPRNPLTPRRTAGIIPACAGSTFQRFHRFAHIWDHPRMCGEHPSPGFSTYPGLGSSPHVRGALLRGVAYGGWAGIIPACAGSTAYTPTGVVDGRDHPRMCGEHRPGR